MNENERKDENDVVAPGGVAEPTAADVAEAMEMARPHGTASVRGPGGRFVRRTAATSASPKPPAETQAPATAEPKAETAPTGEKNSALSAVIKVLREAGTPLGTKEMVEQAIAKGYWQTTGKTPSQTVYSLILREIQAKGEQARFQKTERGKFALKS